MKFRPDPEVVIKIAALAVMALLLVERFYWPVRFVIPQARAPRDMVQEKIFEHSEIADFELSRKLAPEMAEEESPEDIAMEAEMMGVGDVDGAGEMFGPPRQMLQPASLKIDAAIIKPPPALPPVLKGKGYVAIIIDDMGMDRKRSLQMVDMPGGLTLSFLPYAPKLPEITKDAIAKGHELLIHVPMQPLDSHLDPGPLVLRTDMPDASFKDALAHSFNAFSGYAGINNHMGSKLTMDRHAMDMVMEALKSRHLLFVDSKTIPRSVAAQSAAEHGLPYAERDIFLDNENNNETVAKELGQLETIAKRRGYAIAIGHPRDATIAVLREWLPTLKERGLTLVPVSRLVHRPVTGISMSAYGPPHPNPLPEGEGTPVNSFGPVRPQAPLP